MVHGDASHCNYANIQAGPGQLLCVGMETVTDTGQGQEPVPYHITHLPTYSSSMKNISLDIYKISIYVENRI